MVVLPFVLSFGTSVRCSCRNLGTRIIALMLSQVLYVVMDRSGTSVRSARRRLGARPLAVAAAENRVGEDVVASLQPSVAAAAGLRMDQLASVVWRRASVFPQRASSTLHKEHEEQCDHWSGLQIQHVPVIFYFRKDRKPWRRRSSTFTGS